LAPPLNVLKVDLKNNMPVIWKYLFNLKILHKYIFPSVIYFPQLYIASRPDEFSKLSKLKD